jgi:hypothetical protein
MANFFGISNDTVYVSVFFSVKVICPWGESLFHGFVYRMKVLRKWGNVNAVGGKEVENGE